MKTKHWLILIGVILLISVALSILFSLPGRTATHAEIWSGDLLMRTVDLQTDQTFTVETNDGYNVITIENGRIAVTNADCPDQYCMHRGFCNSGSPIVCLPHRLIIKFVGEQAIDGVTG